MEKEKFEIMSEETIDSMSSEIKDAITEIAYDAKFSEDDSHKGYSNKGYSNKVIDHIYGIICGSINI